MWRKVLPPRPSTPVGTVYLCHFDRPYKHGRHYVGFTTKTLDERFKRHLRGESMYLGKVFSLGIGVEIVRTWENMPLSFEYKLKGRGAKVLCPVCRTNAG